MLGVVAVLHLEADRAVRVDARSEAPDRVTATRSHPAVVGLDAQDEHAVLALPVAVT